MEGYDDSSGIIGAALERPMGSTALDRVGPGSRVAVLVEGLHRPTPTYQVLKVVIQRLAEAGVPDNHITWPLYRAISSNFIILGRAWPGNRQL